MGTPVPDGEYARRRDGRWYRARFRGVVVSSVPVTNSWFAEILNAAGLVNRVGGTYLYVNEINPNLPLRSDAGGLRVRTGSEDEPVRGVTWLGSLAFCELVGARLPTELEWEILATGGDRSAEYPWGVEPPGRSLANYGNLYGGPTPVKQFAPNKWGLFDMAGNVREWCADPYHPQRPYPFEAGDRDVAASEYRVVKGGAWDKSAHHLRCSVRAGKWMRIGTAGIGLRPLVTRD